MKIKDFIIFSFIWLVCLGATCKPRLFVPPSELWQNDSPNNLKSRKNTIRVLGGLNSNADFNILGDEFPFNAKSGSVGYRRGILEQLELNVSASFLYINIEDTIKGIRPYVIGIRSGLKYCPSKLQRFLAGRIGIGFGSSDYCQFVSLDYGLTLGFENTYVVPFTNIGGYLSMPFNSDFIFFNNEELETEIYADIPQKSWGLQMSTGVKAYPLSFKKSKRNNRFSFCIYPIFTLTTLNSLNTNSEVVISFGGGIETLF